MKNNTFYMNRKLVYIICLALVMVFVTAVGFCLSAEEIVANAKKATASLSSVKMKGQTLTGGIDITEEETIIDYRAGLYYGIDKKNQKIITTTYCENGFTYINEMFTGAWFRFAPDEGLATNMLDRHSPFNLFPEDASGTGFTITFAGNETVSREPCYKIQSNVFNRELAKLYIQKSLDRLMPRRVAADFKSNPSMLDDYLNAYTQNLQTTLWISQDTFLVKKMQTAYNQLVGPSQFIPVKREVEFYDFNKPVRIKVPEQAYKAQKISLQDLGFK